MNSVETDIDIGIKMHNIRDEPWKTICRHVMAKQEIIWKKVCNFGMQGKVVDNLFLGKKLQFH